MIKEISWVFVKGGILNYGDRNIQRKIDDLLWSQTLITFGQIGVANYLSENMPIANISYFKAMEIAKFFQARLPTAPEWEWMAAGPECFKFPWGNTPWSRTKANIKLSEIGHACEVGKFLDGSTPHEILDVSGNLWEMTFSKIIKDGVIIKGGSYNSNEVNIENKFWNSFPKEVGSNGIGLRLVRQM